MPCILSEEKTIFTIADGRTVDYAQGSIFFNAPLFDEMLFEQIASGFARSPVINLINGEFFTDWELDCCKKYMGTLKYFYSFVNAQQFFLSFSTKLVGIPGLTFDHTLGCRVRGLRASNGADCLTSARW